MRSWDFPIALDDRSSLPLVARIARALIAEMRRGRLLPGQRLPPSRSLARVLGVHRNTVLAAYAELTAEGWIRGVRGSGTFVSTELPETAPSDRTRASRARSRPLGYDLGTALGTTFADNFPRGVLVLSRASPDLRLVGRLPLARAYRRALRLAGPQVLGYGEPQGLRRLRDALAVLLSEKRGLANDPESIVVTRGSQMAYFLVARALLRPGDVIAVESLGYPLAWEAFRLAGGRVAGVPVDEEGLQVGALAKLCQREQVRAVFVTPQHQYPTTVTLSPARRLELLALARSRRIAIIEDDYDHEFHYDGSPVLPLAAMDPTTVIYIGTLSKVLAPGLRLGFVAAPHALVERLLGYRTLIDRQGDLALERAVAELLEDGELQRHIWRMRRIYHSRRDAAVQALRETFGQRVTCALPAGGLALWCQAPGVDVDGWSERALARGIAFFTARRFAFDGQPRPAFRLVFAPLSKAATRQGIERLAKTFAPGRGSLD